MKRVVTMLLALIVIVAALVFTIKYNNEKRIINEPPQAGDKAPEEVFKPTVTEEGESYLLIAEEDYLNLYRIGDSASLKKSERINLSLFPSSDISNLRQGLEYTSAEDAFAAMENFVG